MSRYVEDGYVPARMAGVRARTNAHAHTICSSADLMDTFVLLSISSRKPARTIRKHVPQHSATHLL